MSREMPVLTLPKPSLMHMFAEGRSIVELGVTSMFMPFLLRAPKGDDHPVMVLPGFLASDISTQPIRAFLKLKGYQTYGWGLGRNLGTEIVGGENVISDALINRVIELSVKHDKKVSLVGWSLGGILAREVARLLPDFVRQVVTLGSPFNGPDGSSPLASKLFDMINGDIANSNPQAMLNMLTPPPVPSSAIYSRTDGVAHWQACTNRRIKGSDQAENIEVRGSHLGLGHNHQVIWIVANRLAQNEGTWRPYIQKKQQQFYSDAEQAQVNV
ncbi:MAG: pimeloyl-ACP methyl ester carboxylesterase [Paraglaciecola sp.]|jgi:pimeloyl-ACP methyl ester carboxylesterase